MLLIVFDLGITMPEKGVIKVIAFVVIGVVVGIIILLTQSYADVQFYQVLLSN